MILVLAMSISIFMITLTYVKKLSRNKSTGTKPNVELDKYYSMLYKSLPPQQCYKQLLIAASICLRNIKELEEEKEEIEPLYKDRLVSDEYWNRIVEELKSLSVEKMVIESESEYVKRNSKETIFGEAKKFKVQGDKKTYKINDDLFYDKKKEALEMELRKKLCI